MVGGLTRGIDPEVALLMLEKERCRRSLAYFIRLAWSVVEPGTDYIEGRHIEFICAHLEAITDGVEIDGGGVYNRLIINVPPGFMKSLLLNVFWPAYEWGPRNLPHHRYICVSHSMDNSIRDSTKMRRLITSDWYQERWGDTVKLTGDQNAKTKFENTATGFREATAASGITGKRGDRVILDDPLSWADANSEATRESVNEWVLGALPSRINNPKKSAIVVIMQRLHEDDVTGMLLDGGYGYDHIRLPMRYDSSFPMPPTQLGYVDWRTREGELLFPERYPAEVVDRDEKIMGSYEVAGQHQQVPTPKGGGLIKDEWWKLWEDEQGFPPMDFILGVVDTAYTEKQENDPSAMVVLGVFSVTDNKATVTRTISRTGTSQQVERAYTEGAPNVMLMFAWSKRLAFRDMLNEVLQTARDLKIDVLVIEGAAAGLSLEQELRRVVRGEDFSIRVVKPDGDKSTRINSVAHLLEDGLVWAPDRAWAQMVIRECSSFPKGRHDDLVDCVAHGLRFLRRGGMLTRPVERLRDIEESKQYTRRQERLYPC